MAAGAESTEVPGGEGGAEAGSRTPTPFRALDPESSASASSATPAQGGNSSDPEDLRRFRTSCTSILESLQW